MLFDLQSLVLYNGNATTHCFRSNKFKLTVVNSCFYVKVVTLCQGINVNVVFVALFMVRWLMWLTGGSIRQFCSLYDGCCVQQFLVAGHYNKMFDYLEKLERDIVSLCCLVAIYIQKHFILISFGFITFS